MQKQWQINWCWAAVAVSVHDFLDPQPAAAPLWTQPTLATALLNQVLPGAGLNCSVFADAISTTGCNQAEGLDVALTITGNLRKNGFLAGSYLAFDCLQSWVSVGLPVCARIVWRSEGAHFIALDGCGVTASGQQVVHVQDPIPGVAPSFWYYEDLLDHYDEIGYWDDSYLVTN
jgi:hypothetical protein